MNAPAHPPTGPRLRECLGTAALMALATVLFFWQPLFLDGWTIPAGGGDLAAQYFPYFRFAADSLQQGVFPLWNPYTNAGSPFAADVQTALYYPPNWVAWVLARPLTYDWLEALAMIHVGLGGFFGWLLARRLGTPWYAAFAAGLAFAFSGAMVARIGHVTALATMAWLPLVLLLVLEALRRRSLRWATGAGVALAVAILAGHTQMAYYLVLAAGLLWAWWLLVPARRLGLDRRGWLRIAAILPVTGLFAAGIAAVQLLPTAQLLGLSVRNDLGFLSAVEFSVPPVSLVHLLVPWFFGTTANDYWGITGSLTEGFGYVGIATLVFALLGLLVQRRNHLAWFFLLLAGLGLFLSLGQETALYGWLYRFLPGFDKVRAPGRFLVLFDLGIVMLAAFGIAALGQPVTRRLRWPVTVTARSATVLLVLVGAVLVPVLLYALLTSQGASPVIFERVRTALNSAVLASILLGLAIALLVAWRRVPASRAPLVGILAAALVILDVVSATIRFSPGEGDPTGQYEHPAVFAWLREQPGTFRIDAFTDVGGTWAPNIPMVERIPDAADSPVNPLRLEAFDDYWGALGSRSVPGYELLNVRYVVGSKQVQLDWSRFEPALTDRPRVNLHQHQRELPRALVVPSAQVLPREDLLARLRDTSWDPRQTLLLESAPPVTPAAGTGTVESITFPTTNEVVLRGTGTGGWLLLADTDYPGWRATVNGRPVEVVTANGLFRAVPLPDGPFEVVFTFRPDLWIAGIVVSVVSLGLALGILLSPLAPPIRGRAVRGE